MRQVCYICGILYGLKEPLDNDSETHGICDDCFPIVMEQIRQEREKRNATGHSKEKHTAGD
jgi:hypothetical protein